MDPRSEKRIRIFMAVAIPVAAVCLILGAKWILQSGHPIAECAFHTATGGWCPSCGNTRCVQALLEGNLPLALRSNITIPFLLVLIVALYLENILALTGRHIHILPRRHIVWYIILALFFLYYIARNFIPAIAPI